MPISTKFFVNFITAITLVVIVCTTLIGWSQFVERLGGLKSFGGILALLVMCSVIVGGIIYLQRRNYTNERARQIADLIIAFLVVAVLGLIGWSWIDLPSGAGMKVVLSIGLCALAAAASTLVGEVETN